MHFLPTEKSWRAALLVALAFFVLTRVALLTAFPIFNDEAIYLQYSQAIHADWSKNKFISMNGEFRDWKPPVQYWLAAPFIQLGDDPLVAGRMVSLLFSMVGFLGIYAFAKELFGEGEGVIASILYLLCPTVLLHNNQFTAETFLFSTAPFLYWAVLCALHVERRRWVWALLAVALGTWLLLLKQSGFLLLAISIALPFARLRTRGEPGRWKVCAINCVFVGALILLAVLLSKAVLPAQFNATRAEFDRKWVMSATELLKLPADAWRANLRLVSDYIGAYYTWALPLLLCPIVWVAFRNRREPELALLAMATGGAGAVVFLLRGFNEYMVNTAVVAILLPLLSRAVTHAWNLARSGGVALLRAGLLALAAFILAHWSYQMALIGISSGRYIERSTPWAVRNYLKSWSTGFGVNDVVALLDKIDEPGVVFVDTQWGNPATAIELYAARRFPNLKIFPITKEFLDANEARKLRDLARGLGKVHLAIFSADASNGRTRWREIVEREMCEDRMEVKAFPGQTPIVVCRF